MNLQARLESNGLEINSNMRCIEIRGKYKGVPMDKDKQ